MAGDFTFGFWNCAISPPGQNDPIDEGMVQAAFLVIKSLFDEHQLGMLFICEINSDSFLLLSKLTEKIGLQAIIANEKTPTGSRFDLACLYVPSVVNISKDAAHIGRIGTSKVKVAQGFSVSIVTDEEPIFFLLSHWPSRLQGISATFRHECSFGLRLQVNTFQEQGQSFILLGDYNDDPYSKTIFENLRATNDRALVISSPDYWLYNPFWRALYARNVFSKASLKHDFGTCYSKANNRNSWSTFDQIIFSGDFLHKGKWLINEEGCQVVSDEKYINLIMSDKNKFDHLPVIGSISKN